MGANLLFVFRGQDPNIRIQLLLDALNLGHGVCVPNRDHVFVPLRYYALVPLWHNPCIPFVLCPERDGFRSGDKTLGVRFRPIDVWSN